MPDNLRITTPINTNENIGKIRQTKESPVVETIDPARVSARNNNDQADQKNTLDFLWDNRSVFQKFVEQLQKTPALSQTLEKILLGSLGQGNMIDGSSTIHTLIRELLNQTEMNATQILENILFQAQNSTKFSGDFFDVLRALYKQADTPQLKECLGRFLKAYDGYFSSKQTMGTVQHELEQICSNLPKTYREQVEEKLSQLIPSDKGTDINLKLLKDEILPILGKYVAMSNDFGETREKITLLLHDLSRLNVSTREEVVNRFQELMDFCQFELNVPVEKLNQLKSLFAHRLIEPKQTENQFIDSLTNMLLSPSKEGLSNTSITMLRETVNALLMDNSVYMPFTHIFLPVQYHGAFLFSEIWIEKDAEDQNKGRSDEQPITLYLAFEIKDLGSFKAAITLQDHHVDCQIELPPRLADKGGDIQRELTNIFTRNGMIAENIVSVANSDKVTKEVLRKILEKGRAVDVTI